MPFLPFLPLDSYIFINWADREHEKEGFVKAYSQLIGIPELDPLLTLMPTSLGLASSQMLSPVLHLRV